MKNIIIKVVITYYYKIRLDIKIRLFIVDDSLFVKWRE